MRKPIETEPTVIISSSGVRKTFKNGYLHSFNDEPSVVYPDNKLLMWHKDGLLHRVNKQPALLSDAGKREYFFNGLLHRVGAPAREWGGKIEISENYFYGEKLDPDAWDFILKEPISEQYEMIKLIEEMPQAYGISFFQSMKKES